MIERETERLSPLLLWSEKGLEKFLKNIKGWPLFLNFDRNIAPGFCFAVLQQEGVLAQDVLKDHMFAMCGGPKQSADLTVDAGTEQSPSSSRMEIHISCEDIHKEPGTEFMYVVQGTEIRTPKYERSK